MDSVFNADERAAQRLAGRGEPAGGGIRTFMPLQHREFFAALPYGFLGLVGTDGWPVATMLAGPPGFLSTPDDRTIHVATLPDDADPAAPATATGSAIALLGLDFATRRRNRANGIVSARDAGSMTIAVQQSFGNCPQYIAQRRIISTSRDAGPVEPLSELDADAAATIGRAASFFVASRARADLGDPHGADVSHRGGAPGFVKVAGDRLTIPDFRGNRYFNTLGNLLGDPRAALLFVDFERGDMIQLQGVAEIDWQTAPEGAERQWHVTVTRGWRRRRVAGIAEIPTN